MSNLPECSIGGQINTAYQSLILLNLELAKQEERDQEIVGICIDALGSLSPRYKFNDDKSKIEDCVFDCTSCQSEVSIECSEPIMLVRLPNNCPESSDLRVLEA